MSWTGSPIQVIKDRNRGRPRYDVQEAQLQFFFFIGFGFRVSETAKMLAVSQAIVNMVGMPFSSVAALVSCYCLVL